MMRCTPSIGLSNGDWTMIQPNSMVRPMWGWGDELGSNKSLHAMGCMKLDAFETEDEFKVYCECPGIPKENIEVQIENNMLTIKGHKEKK